MKRIQMNFEVTVLVDVHNKRPGHLKDMVDPVEYAKRFVALTPVLYGSHDIDLVDGQIVKSLTIVDWDANNIDAYVI